MKSKLFSYLENINIRFKTGISTEHSYRGDLQNLIKELENEINITNEPKRQKCGAPDFIIRKKEVPIGYIEAKDIGTDLDKIEKSEQLKKYLNSLDNLILTDYIEFRFFRNNERLITIKLGTIENNKIKIYPDNFETFENYISDFCSYYGTTIKSAEKLSKMMAKKAYLMENVIYKVVTEENEDNSLKDQLKAFRKILIHDLEEKTFAEIYAQTIAYGLFAARLHDPTLDTFSRAEARELIPRSNPFLRNLFDYIAGAQLDDRVVWIVDDLADIFRATDLNDILSDFGKATKQTDPFIHFYETFLAEYKPKLRKKRGVYYTPEPVVNFIVRAVDYILKEEFKIKDGLADKSKTTIEIDSQIPDKRTKSGYKQIEKQVHKVQILDPATGTGTFLAEVVKHIYHNKFKGQEGIWSKYVDEHLIPRLNGFEILMAPYTICYLKLEILLKEYGYNTKSNKHQKRFRVFLTNSLEEAHPDTGTIFASWLSKESAAANYVKKETPVMVVLGNPPYSVSSSNKGEWIQNLIKDYKKNLNERKINLDDDYIKFIRYGEYFIDKNNEGILAYISNNSFLDGITHRQMRKHLLKTFDKIFILNLHGSSMKKEKTPKGTKDENVFDIRQGVSINIFIKNVKKKENEMGKVFYYDLYGNRRKKYNFLSKTNLKNIKWNKLNYKEKYYFLVPKDFSMQEKYSSFFSLAKLMPKYVSGFQTKRDKITIQFEKKDLKKIKDFFQTNNVSEIRRKYNLPKDGRDWKIKWAKKDIQSNYPKILKVMYRPFDERYTFYTGNSKGFVAYPREDMFKHLNFKNITLITCRQQSSFDFQHVFISKLISDMCNISSQTKETGYIFPLYLYLETDKQPEVEKTNIRQPNLNMEIVEKISDGLNLTFTAEKDDTKGTFAPIDILDYIYAVLHSPTYRKKYKEFLKIDFPRIPYPQDKKTFWNLVKLGGELREIHLLDSPKVEEFITRYPVDGSNIISKRLTKTDPGFKITDKENKIGRIWINDDQYFDNVPLKAWEFYIGGYQPAQKWLKYRRNRELSYDDIIHYQKIIVALMETDRIMKKIDNI